MTKITKLLPQKRQQNVFHKNDNAAKTLSQNRQRPVKLVTNLTTPVKLVPKSTIVKLLSQIRQNFCPNFDKRRRCKKIHDFRFLYKNPSKTASAIFFFSFSSKKTTTAHVTTTTYKKNSDKIRDFRRVYKKSAKKLLRRFSIFFFFKKKQQRA